MVFNDFDVKKRLWYIKTKGTNSKVVSAIHRIHTHARSLTYPLWGGKIFSFFFLRKQTQVAPCHILKLFLGWWQRHHPFIILHSFISFHSFYLYLEIQMVFSSSFDAKKKKRKKLSQHYDKLFFAVAAAAATEDNVIWITLDWLSAECVYAAAIKWLFNKSQSIVSVRETFSKWT